jgi:hypothetical protein
MKNQYKQFQGSKKKARKMAFLLRQAEKADARLRKLKFNVAMGSNNIEEMADTMGVKLK